LTLNAAMQLALRVDPSLVLDLAGFAAPDAWQRRLIRSTAELTLVNCHRQSGKSTATAGLAVVTALHEPGSLTLIVSAAQRQSDEVYAKVQAIYRALGRPQGIAAENATELRLGNESRIVSLPDSPDTIVGYSGPRLVIIDESSRVSDETFVAVSPMLSVSRGRMVCLSTPRGRRGFWFYLWHDEAVVAERIMFTAEENPRIDPAWLDSERRRLGSRAYRQEYRGEFLEAEDAVFNSDTVMNAFKSTRPPLVFGSRLG
jgi:hypothetical protein